jgi:putative ABC transport system permease protein
MKLQVALICTDHFSVLTVSYPYSCPLCLRGGIKSNALGAQASTVVSLVLRQGIKIVLLGLAVGVVIALSLGHVLDSMLYQVSAIDPPSIAISVLVLGVSTFVACLLPACRATQIDPITALRE